MDLIRRHREFVRKTRRGHVIKQLREHYLRNDITCGSKLCSECLNTQEPRLEDSEDGPVLYVVPDTNVVVCQLDVLEHKALRNVIFLQTVLQETKHVNRKSYYRARELAEDVDSNVFVFCNEHHRDTYVQQDDGESPNDRNDRAIRAAVRWYSQHLSGRARVVLVSEDAENLRLARAAGLEGFTVRKYLETFHSARPELLDLMATDEGATGRKLWPEHWSEAKMKEGLRLGTLHQGTFRMSRFRWGCAEVAVEAFPEPLLVQGVNCNRSVDGDRVAVRVLPKSEWVHQNQSLRDRDKAAGPDGVDVDVEEEEEEEEEGEKEKRAPESEEVLRPTACVVAIIRRQWRSVCGSLAFTKKTSGSVLFLPVQRTMPKMILNTRQVERLMDKRIVVQPDSWPADSSWPHAHYVRTLGCIGDRDTETQVLLLEHEVDDDPWSASVMACLPGADYAIPPEEVARRIDLRPGSKHAVHLFSIDPPGCKDIDDALHIRKLPNGNFEVGVHIADVTFFMKPDTPLDAVAQERGTSVYLVERRIDMIPTRLSTDLCSLVERKDRLAFSVFWELNSKAEILDTRFSKTVICSVAAMAYSEAQERIDFFTAGRPAGKQPYKCRGDDAVLDQACTWLNGLAKQLRSRRMVAGALTLASPEVKFKLDVKQEPTDVALYKLTEAHALVEEFMLLANISVAKRILQHFPQHAMLRRHPTPPDKKLEGLVKAARTAGVILETGTSKQLADSLDRAVLPENPLFNQMLRILATRCMYQAVYFSSGEVEPHEYHHYGLATPLYTHFTSPIRRYADVVVHRLLATAIGVDPLSASLEGNRKVAHIAHSINHRTRMAQMAGRASVSLYTHVFFRDRGRVLASAVIMSVHRNGVRVLVAEFGIEGTVRFRTKDTKQGKRAKEKESAETGEVVAYHEEEMRLTVNVGGAVRELRVFAPIRVAIFVRQDHMRREELALEMEFGEEKRERMEETTPPNKRRKL